MNLSGILIYIAIICTNDHNTNSELQDKYLRNYHKTNEVRTLHVDSGM